MSHCMRLVCLAVLLTGIVRPAEARTYHIMLQGFYWEAPNQHAGTWYTHLRNNKQKIADSGFNLVWFPPPGTSTGWRPQGYEPVEYYKLDNAYGSRQNLQDVIYDLGTLGIKAIADIVINHRSGKTGWADFVNPSWNTWQSICKNDEWSGSKSPNYDTGTGEASSRDLDHKQATVSLGIKAWMKWLKDDIGFWGWRYDMVKGYAGWAVAMYNDFTTPGFTVGEYLDGDVNAVVGWVNSSHADYRKRATAFDFPLRYALYDAVVNRKYNYLKYGDKLTGLVGMWPDKAVTFVENHDTEEARGGAYAQAIPNDGRMLQAYAFILTHPGTPCVYWPDIYKTGREYEGLIRAMIWARKHYGIHSESRVYIAKAAQGDCYAAYIQGDNGEIAMKIGPGAWSPSGSKWQPASDLITSGPDYAVWGEHGRWWRYW